MIDYKSKILQQLSITTVLQRFGLKMQHSFINCPFHADDTASCRIYTETNTFYCFGCGTGGNVIDFAMAWYRLDFLSAMERLNDEFSLGLPFGRKLTLREKYIATLQAQKAAAEKTRQQQEKAAVFDAYWKALDQLRLYEKLINLFRPTDPDALPHPMYGMALHHIENAIYELEEAEGQVIAYGSG